MLPGIRRRWASISKNLLIAFTHGSALVPITLRVHVRLGHAGVGLQMLLGRAGLGGFRADPGIKIGVIRVSDVINEGLFVGNPLRGDVLALGKIEGVIKWIVGDKIRGRRDFTVQGLQNRADRWVRGEIA